MAVEENAAAAPEAAAADGPPPLSTTSPPPPYIVPPELIRAFKRDSVVVLPDVFTPEEVAEARAGMAATLKAHGVVRACVRALRDDVGGNHAMDSIYPHEVYKGAHTRTPHPISHISPPPAPAQSNPKQNRT